MSQAAKAQEPTMEEILASIRRIIADDDVSKSPAAPAKQPAVGGNQHTVLSAFDDAEEDAAQTASDVFELTEAMQSEAAAFGTIDGPPDVMFSDAPEPEEPAPPPARAARPVATTPQADRSLVSPRTAAAVDMAFNSLAHTVLVQNSRTLEDLVREMLKPMLKAWLDDNLPNMVERMVRAEIERVSRGRG
jgi:cell pole-organizing protein PopZ